MDKLEVGEKEWIEHCKTCGSCRSIGKWNNRGGTTESYHAFVNGYMAIRQQLQQKDKQHKDDLKKLLGLLLQYGNKKINWLRFQRLFMEVLHDSTRRN